MDLRTFAAGFGRVSFIGDDKFTAQCPAHDDEGAALQVRQEGARQRMLCARRCSATAILEARNLRIGGGGRARSLETEDDVECSTSESTSDGLISIRAVTVEDSVGTSSSSAEAGALPASGTSPQGAPNGNGWGAPRTNGNGTHANSNGHVPTPTFRRLTLAQWQNQLLALAMKQLKDDPEYQKPIAGEDMLEPLCADLEVGLEALVAYGQGPPSDLTAQDIKDECEQASRLAIEAWCNRLIWSKAVVPSANAPALLETENLPVIRPEDILRPLSLGQLYDLVDEWDRQPWVWDGILPHSSLSLIVGKSETGKSTLTYALLYAIVKGLTFFGRQCEQGRVLYLAGDPMSEVVAGKTFKGLGLDRDDGVMVLPGALAANPSGMRQLRDIVQSFKPAIVVGDTLAATVEIDTEKYGQSQKAQHPLVKIARDLGPNFLMSHHSQKSAIDSYSVIDSALGTVGVAAVASSRMGTKMYRRGKERFYTFEMSNLRIGQPIEGEWIVKKYDNGLMELDGLWAGRAAVLDTEAIVKALEEHGDDWIAGRTLWQETSPKPKYGVFMQALRGLVKEKAVETDKRPGKGGGYLYRKALNQPAPQPDFYKDS